MTVMTNKPNVPDDMTDDELWAEVDDEQQVIMGQGFVDVLADALKENDSDICTDLATAIMWDSEHVSTTDGTGGASAVLRRRWIAWRDKQMNTLHEKGMLKLKQERP